MNRGAILFAAAVLLAMAFSRAAPVGEGPVERVIVRFESARDVPREGETFLGYPVVRAIPALAAAAITGPPGVAAAALAEPGVRSVEPDLVGSARFTPSDPHWSAQASFRAIRADLAWDLRAGGEDTLVAVLDTGVDAGHPDLRANLWVGPSGEHGWNAIENSTDVADEHGHGTHVAGIVGAVLGNAQGVAGLAQVDVAAVKALDASGQGFTSDVAAGLDWASQQSARVALVALSFTTESPTLSDAVALATARGTLVVAAAGDAGASPAVGWPAAHPDALAVAALGASATTAASFSPAGPEIDLAAPGVGVLSTTPTYATSPGLTPNYDDLSGTSVAAAHVAGVAALVAASDPRLGAPAIRALLEARAVDLGAPGRDDATGAGRVDAFSALRALDVPPDAHAGGPYEVDEGSPVTFTAARSRGLGLSFAWDLDGDGATDSTAREATRTFADERAHAVRLTVANATGSTSTREASLVVRNVAPSVVVARDRVNVTVGSPVSLAGSATDPGADALTPTWRFGDASSAGAFSATHAYATVGEFDAVLEVADGDGGVGNATTRVSVRGVDLVARSVSVETPKLLGVVPVVTQRLVRLTVENVGPDALATPFRVRFTYAVENRTGTLGDAVVPSIAGRGSAVATFTWNVTGRFGDYTVRAAIDPLDLVPEGEEANNAASRTVTLLASDPTGGRAAAAMDALLGSSELATTDEPGDYDTDGIPDRGDLLNLPSESRVRASARNWVDFALRPGAVATVVAPDGKEMIVRSGTFTGVARVLFNGSVPGAPAGSVEVTGDLVSAAADGTWTIVRPLDAGGRPTGYAIRVAGKLLTAIGTAEGGEAWPSVSWNWHMQREAWRHRGSTTTIGGVLVDPAESPAFARYYASDLSAVALPQSG